MNPIRLSILDYLAHGQASLSALVEATGHRPLQVRTELDAMLAANLITEQRIECPRLKITVYLLASPS